MAKSVKLVEDFDDFIASVNAGLIEAGMIPEKDDKKKASNPALPKLKKSNYGKRSTQLVGTMSAGSRLARKAQWKKIGEKSSAD